MTKEAVKLAKSKHKEHLQIIFNDLYEILKAHYEIKNKTDDEIQIKILGEDKAYISVKYLDSVFQEFNVDVINYDVFYCSISDKRVFSIIDVIKRVDEYLKICKQIKKMDRYYKKYK